MKKLIILIILFSFNLQAQPAGIISNLMDTPVSKFTYGMNECNNYLNKKEYYINEAFEDITPKKKYGLVTSNCDYEFDENEIRLIFFCWRKISKWWIHS